MPALLYEGHTSSVLSDKLSHAKRTSVNAV